MMKDLLFLAHRIPYPPNKGDKIRSFHFLKGLCQQYRVHLGAFVDDPDDHEYSSYLGELCESTHFQSIHPAYRKILSTKGLLTDQALSIPYYFHSKMDEWVKETIRTHRIDKVLVFSSTMAQYVVGQPDIQCYVDFVDVDSDKWRQYSAKKSGISRFIYQREADKLLQFERQVARDSVRSLFVSEKEAELFEQLAPEVADKVEFINNGVDVDYFSPEHELANPYPNDAPVMVFTGAMDYWANVDAVCWFAHEVLPDILNEQPDAQFYIVGSKPTKAVQELAEMNNVHVTGRVEDVRPYLAHADLVAAPMRIARGIQNKVLEGLAMDKPIVATTAAMEGIEGLGGLNLEVEDEPQPFAAAVQNYLRSNLSEGSKQNRAFVREHFSWASSGDKLAQLLSAD